MTLHLVTTVLKSYCNNQRSIKIREPILMLEELMEECHPHLNTYKELRVYSTDDTKIVSRLNRTRKKWKDPLQNLTYTWDWRASGEVQLQERTSFLLQEASGCSIQRGGPYTHFLLRVGPGLMLWKHCCSSEEEGGPTGYSREAALHYSMIAGPPTPPCSMVRFCQNIISLWLLCRHLQFYMAKKYNSVISHFYDLSLK